MLEHIHESLSAYRIQYAYAPMSGHLLKPMKEEINVKVVENILHEASTVLQAALQHASELSEVGVSADEFHLMRVLITHVAAHTYTSLENRNNYSTEVRDLKIIKEVIVRTAEMRFGHTSKVLNEFKYAAQHSSIV